MYAILLFCYFDILLFWVKQGEFLKLTSLTVFRFNFFMINEQRKVCIKEAVNLIVCDLQCKDVNARFTAVTIHIDSACL